MKKYAHLHLLVLVIMAVLVGFNVARNYTVFAVTDTVFLVINFVILWIILSQK